MIITDINFSEWLRKFTHPSPDPETDGIVYENVEYTEDEVRSIYLGLKLTEADISGFNSIFTIQLRRKEFLTTEQVKEYVFKEVINTATVIEIRHKDWLYGLDIRFQNQEYKKPFKPAKQQ